MLTSLKQDVWDDSPSRLKQQELNLENITLDKLTGTNKYLLQTTPPNGQGLPQLRIKCSSLSPCTKIIKCTKVSATTSPVGKLWFVRLPCGACQCVCFWDGYWAISFLYFFKIYFLCGVKSILMESIILKILSSCFKLFFSIVFSKTFCKLPSPK